MEFLFTFLKLRGSRLKQCGCTNVQIGYLTMLSVSSAYYTSSRYLKFMNQTEVKEIFDDLLEVLSLEKEEDFYQHKQFIERLPIAERIAKGYTWHPIVLQKTGFTFGERAFVIVHRTSHLGEPSHFRSGKLVNLYSTDVGNKRGEVAGVIHYVEKDKMKIILSSKSLPSWVSDAGLGVDLMFDERTYLEMEKALKLVKKANGGRLAELRDILLGAQQPSFQKKPEIPAIPRLNESQLEAVQDILEAQDVAIIHGPPGTGKTTTIVQAVKELSKIEKSILVCAPSNTAVDLLTERIAYEGLSVLRIGNISRIDEEIVKHTLEVQLANHPEAKTVKKIRQQADEDFRKAKRYKRKFGRKEHSERRLLFKEAGELLAWAKTLEQRMLDEILDAAQVITCTLVGSSNEVLGSRKFRTVIIDEAAQALEPATWIPLLRASRVVLTGDPFQLPPTVKSKEARKRDFGVTLIEKCLKRGMASTLLRIQYRMHELIMGFSNQQFYGNKLKAHPTVATHQLEIEHNKPVVFIDTAGCGFDEQMEEKYRSLYNPSEFQILEEHLLLLKQAHEGLMIPSIAIISPYREQVLRMKDQMKEDGRLEGLDVTVNTIDGFQGQERDVVYISLVRSNAKTEIGFLGDTRRMNVAMTRARKQLIVVGDSATIGAHPFYQAFLDYCEKRGTYQTAWEYMQ